MNSAEHYSFVELRKQLQERGKIKLPGESFTLGIDCRMNLCLLNCRNNRNPEAEDDSFYVDQYPYKNIAEDAGREQCERLEYTSFVYSGKSKKIYAVDPDNLELWKLNPDQRGVKIRVRGLTNLFPAGDGNVTGFENVSFTIKPSEFVGIYGGSGAGKTTLIKSILNPPQCRKVKNRLHHGVVRVYVDGQKEKAVDGLMAYLPQQVDIPENLTCGKIFSLAMSDRGITTHTERKKLLEKNLPLCVLDEGLLAKRFAKLSGGQKRRVALCATLLRHNIRLLIVDEPTTGLDIVSEREVVKTLRRISRYGITVIAITHAAGLCRYFDRVLVLQKHDSQHGAKLVFNGLFDRNFLAEQQPDWQTFSDAEILAKMISPSLDFQIGLQPDLIWAFDKFDKQKCLQNQSEATSKKFNQRRLKNLFNQWSHWFGAAATLVWRDKKGLLIFLGLSVLCTLAIQIGVQVRGRSTVLLVALIPLAAAWLSATYSAIFSAKLSNFFAWEKLSGLRSTSFTCGIFASLVIPAVIMAFVFVFGLHFAPSNEGIARTPMSLFTPLRLVFNPGNNSSNDGRLKNKESVKENHDLNEENPIRKGKTAFLPWAVNLACRVGKIVWEWLESCFYNPTEVLKNNKNVQTNADYPIGFSAGKPMGLIEEFFLNWLLLTFICMTGSSIGLLMTAILRDVKNATLSLVVLFLVFILFSRLLIDTDSYMAPCSCWSAPKIEFEAKVPVYASFACLGRYVANTVFLVFNGQFFSKPFAVEIMILLSGFMVFPLIITIFLYSLKKRNLKVVLK